MTPADLEFDLVTREPDIPILPMTSDGFPLRFIRMTPSRFSGRMIVLFIGRLALNVNTHTHMFDLRHTGNAGSYRHFC